MFRENVLVKTIIISQGTQAPDSDCVGNDMRITMLLKTYSTLLRDSFIDKLKIFMKRE